jgi:hypothetical protein
LNVFFFLARGQEKHGTLMGDSTFHFAIRIVATTFGVLGGGFLGNLLAPWIARSRRGQSGTLLGGAALGGLIMWLAVNYTGGTGFGLGPGQGSGKGPGEGVVSKDEAAKDGKAAVDKDHAAKGAPTTIAVTVLGGERVDRREQRFYVLDGARPRTRKEIEEAIEQQKSKNPALKNLMIVLYTDSVPKDNAAVTGLQEWARDHGMTTAVKEEDKPAP